MRSNLGYYKKKILLSSQNNELVARAFCSLTSNQPRLVTLVGCNSCLPQCVKITASLYEKSKFKSSTFQVTSECFLRNSRKKIWRHLLERLQTDLMVKESEVCEDHLHTILLTGSHYFIICHTASRLSHELHSHLGCVVD